jgi:hypothetical protein
MKMKFFWPVLTAGLSLVILSGCVISERAHYREDPGPYGRGPREGPGPRSDVIIVHRAPPPPMAEQIGPPPGPGWVWVPGYWEGRGDRWYWVSGRYMQPPHPGARWVEPRYMQRSSTEFEFSIGVWR